jgi:hypothetical protein
MRVPRLLVNRSGPGYYPCMVKPLDMPADREKLKQLLHEKIELLDAQKLSLLSNVMLQLEAEELVQKLDSDFDQDRRKGRLDNQRIQKVISEVRSEHKY